MEKGLSVQKTQNIALRHLELGQRPTWIVTKPTEVDKSAPILDFREESTPTFFTEAKVRDKYSEILTHPSVLQCYTLHRYDQCSRTNEFQ